MQKLFFITGASGSGKTTVLKAFAKRNNVEYKILYFDSIGVPTNNEMIARYGSTDNWQKAMTENWVAKIKSDSTAEEKIILDGQMKLSFIVDACDKYDITNYRIILFDCNDKVRSARLVGRGQPELANEQMMNWAKHLRDSVPEYPKAAILENSELTIEETKAILLRLLR